MIEGFFVWQQVYGIKRFIAMGLTQLPLRSDFVRLNLIITKIYSRI